MSASEIERRLGISKNSALLLKRRLQLFASDQMEKVKSLMQRELTEKFPDSASGETKLPPTAGDQHVSTVLGDRPVPQADSCVLYSASQRANQGRKRHKHTGQTASIYLANKLGGKQVGTLVHTLSWKGGPIIYDSIPNNQAQTLRPLLDKYIPKNVPLFTDEGYKFYYRINRNHRMVNHNRKSADPRYKWARNRWSINGIHNQVAEGNHRNLKYHFTAGYSYIRPEFSQLYLNEYAFWKSLKYYGWSKLIDQRLRDHLENSQTQRSAQEQVEQSSRSATGTKGSCGSTATTLTSDFPVQLQYPRPMKPYVRRTPNAKRKDNTARNEARIPQESTQEYSPQKTKTQNFVDNFKNPESSIDSRRALNLPSSNAIASQDAIAFPSREQNKYVLSSPIAVSANLSSGSSLSKVTGSNPAFRIIESEQVPTSATGSDSFAVSPDPTSLGFVSLRYPLKNWLQVRLQSLQYKPPTLEERKSWGTQGEEGLSAGELSTLLSPQQLTDHETAKRDYESFLDRQTKSDKASQKLYEYYAARLWEFLDEGEWSDLDSVIDTANIPRAKAYRIIRLWALRGFASVVDRSHPDGYNFKFIYDLKRTFPFLPNIRYVLRRSEFANFHALYEQKVQRHYVQRKSKEKYQ
ncbi:transposase [Turneriella parva]|uniref:transposase n=1 Tax=Turneriella parva TaxID=29510 RepID=UPI0003162E9C|nr:transposase [Turneriella parva]